MNTLLAANIACLQQGIDLLAGMPTDTYCRACDQVFNSSIGGHIRHNIDHYLAFLEGHSRGEIDYDDRRREAGIETDPQVAAGLMESLLGRMEALAGSDLDEPMRIRMDDGGDATWSRTTLRRELQFLLSHTIHHYALVVSIATRFGIREFPPQFGVAPSTIHHLQGKGT